MLPQTQLHHAHGLTWLLFDNADYITKEVRRDGVFEADLIPYSHKLLNNSQPGIVLDIGANMGTYTVPMATVFPEHQFHSFEPQTTIFYQLCANLLLNRLDNVKTHQLALGNAPGSIDIAVPDYYADGNIGGFSLDPLVREHEPNIQGRTETIKLVTLDSLNFNNIRLIKIDVEGLELSVLQGATETLARNNYPPIVFESWTQFEWWKDRAQELMAYLESLGYTIHDVCSNNYAAIKQ